ncbi:hypothetical protein VTO42DRAFT_4795 [Malbranchea cinnamomea]
MLPRASPFPILVPVAGLDFLTQAQPKTFRRIPNMGAVVEWNGASAVIIGGALPVSQLLQSASSHHSCGLNGIKTSNFFQRN